jgi:hypothetical protein
MVRERISFSVSMSFLDILMSYPFGAGLASAFGTSIPYFLEGTPGLHSQIGLESEYARLLLEEGVLGLATWVSLAVYSSFRRQSVHDLSPTASAYLRALLLLSWLTGALGTGALSSVPGSLLIFVAVGIRLAESPPAHAPSPLGFVAPRRAFPPRAKTVRPLAVARTSR